MPPKGTTSVRKHDLVQDVADDSLKGRKHSEKPKADGAVPKQIKVAEKRSHPTTLEMVKEALKALESRKDSPHKQSVACTTRENQRSKGTENSDPNMVKPEVKTKAKVTGSEKPKPVTKKAKIQASGSTEVLASKVAPAKKPKKAAGNKEVTKPKVGTGPRARKVTSSATQLEGEGKAANKRGKTAL